MRGLALTRTVAVVAILLLGGSSFALVVHRMRSEPNVTAYEPVGAGYSFNVPSDFKLIYFKRPSKPEGRPASGHRNESGIIISAWWDGAHAARVPVSRSTLAPAAARVTGVILEEEAENRNRVRRRRGSYVGFVQGPESLVLAGRPARHFSIERTEASGKRVRSESYVVFKGRTPFRLECIWPVDSAEEAARSVCLTVTNSLRLATAPITR